MLVLFFIRFQPDSALAQTSRIHGIISNQFSTLPDAAITILDSAGVTTYGGMLSGPGGVYDITYVGPTRVDEQKTLPHGFSLLPNYPNPFNPETRIQFFNESSGSFTLRVVDVLGRTLISKDVRLEPGWHAFNVAGLGAAGVKYFALRAKTTTGSDISLTRPMVQTDGTQVNPRITEMSSAPGASLQTSPTGGHKGYLTTMIRVQVSKAGHTNLDTLISYAPDIQFNPEIYQLPIVLPLPLATKE
jgi:hypothetical protein